MFDRSSVIFDGIIMELTESCFQHVYQLLVLLPYDILQDLDFEVVEAQVWAFYSQTNEAVLLGVYVSQVFNPNSLQDIALPNNASSCQSLGRE